MILFYLVVCSEVVNLSPEHLRPEVFTDKLHYVQLIFKAGGVPGQSAKYLTQTLIRKSMNVAIIVANLVQNVCYLPLNESLSNPEAHGFQNRNTHRSVLHRKQNISTITT